MPLRDQEQKKKSVLGSFVSGFENGHMESTRQTVLFSLAVEHTIGEFLREFIVQGSD